MPESDSPSSGSTLPCNGLMVSRTIENRPFVDEHILEILLLVSFAIVDAGRWLGFGERWAKTRLVRSLPILQ